MKKTLPYLTIFALSLLMVYSCKEDDENIQLEPTVRYFRFRGCPEKNYDNWRDTSFVAATSDPKVIQQCLEQLALSFENRSQFPLGKLSSGNGGYNLNGSHSFKWHFEEDMWELVDVGIEIYDGCPYSEAELSDYQGTLGSYGGWGNRIVEELTP